MEQRAVSLFSSSPSTHIEVLIAGNQPVYFFATLPQWLLESIVNCNTSYCNQVCGALIPDLIATFPVIPICINYRKSVQTASMSLPWLVVAWRLKWVHQDSSKVRSRRISFNRPVMNVQCGLTARAPENVLPCGQKTWCLSFTPVVNDSISPQFLFYLEITVTTIRWGHGIILFFPPWNQKRSPPSNIPPEEQNTSVLPLWNELNPNTSISY